MAEFTLNVNMDCVDIDEMTPVSPSSTIIGTSEVHTGLTSDPAATLEHLFRTLVRR